MADLKTKAEWQAEAAKRIRTCPTCGSPSPERHPAVQWEGEVHICVDDFHLRPIPENRPEWIAQVHAKRARLAERADG